MLKNIGIFIIVLFIGFSGKIYGANEVAIVSKEKKDVLELKFRIAPVLGYAGKDFFTVACRMNLPSEALLVVNNKEYANLKPEWMRGL